jgi:hypothetical protein
MLRQIMVVIVTPLGHAQTYNQGVRSFFVIKRINTHHNNSSSNRTKTNGMLHKNVIIVFTRRKKYKII